MRVGGVLTLTKNAAYALNMKRRPFSYFIIVVNIGLLYSLLSSLQEISDENGQSGAFMGYILVAGFINLILYVLFKISAKRTK
jgi:hypothetical protein